MEVKTQTEDFKMLKSLLKDKDVETYQRILQELENGTPSSVSNQSLELTSRLETPESHAFTSQLLKLEE